MGPQRVNHGVNKINCGESVGERFDCWQCCRVRTPESVPGILDDQFLQDWHLIANRLLDLENVSITDTSSESEVVLEDI